jgi:hypothetical protein
MRALQQCRSREGEEGRYAENGLMQSASSTPDLLTRRETGYISVFSAGQGYSGQYATGTKPETKTFESTLGDMALVFHFPLTAFPDKGFGSTLSPNSSPLLTRCNGIFFALNKKCRMLTLQCEEGVTGSDPGETAVQRAFSRIAYIYHQILVVV